MSNLPAPPKNPHPLWVISMFFIFTEVVLGIAVFNTEGGIQVALTWFVILFPIVNAGIFYWILVNKPQNFYPPEAYSNDESFLKAMNSEKADKLGLIAGKLETTIQDFLTSPHFVNTIASADKDKLPDILNSEVQKISNEIKQAAFITVDISAFSDSSPLVLPIDALSTIDNLTNEVYFELAPAVRPYAYGHDWVLINTETEETITVVRMISEAPAGIPLTDKRSLEEMNIKPGAVLRALPVLKTK